MTKVLVLFLFSICYLQSVAQNDYRKGFVIDFKEDTIKGFCAYKTSGARYKECSFKSGPESPTINYKPGDIKSYGFFEGSYFESHPESNEFLEILVGGKTQLLTSSQNFVLKDSTGKYYPLLNSQNKINVNGNSYAYDRKEYIGILKMSLTECQSLQSKIDRVAYTLKSLTKLVEKYNRCTGSYKELPNSGKKYITAYAGLMFSLMDIKLSRLVANTPVNKETLGSEEVMSKLVDIKNFTKSQGVNYGVFFNFRNPRLQEKISATIEILYQKAKFTSGNTYEASATTSRTNVVDQEIKFLRVPFYLSLDVKRQHQRIYPVLSAGLSINFNQDDRPLERLNNTVTEGGHFYETRHFNDPFFMRPLTSSFLFGVGAKGELTSKIIILLSSRYEIGNGPIQFNYADMPPGTYRESRQRFLSATGSICYKLF